MYDLGTEYCKFFNRVSDCLKPPNTTTKLELIYKYDK